jgi:protein phosphatase 2C
VISEPEIKTIRRTNEDEFLIFASDGLWDVLSNEMACNVVRQSLDEVQPADPVGLIAPTGPSTTNTELSEPSTSLPEDQQQHGDAEEGEEQMEPRCCMASAILTRLALGRGSGDNISVIVVDLRRS